MTDTARLIDTTHYSIGFPEEDWKNLLTRLNYTEQIASQFDNGHRIVFLEGEDDSGKTTLVAQFCKARSGSSLSVMFNPHNQLDYRIDFFYSNLVNQIKYLLADEKDVFEFEAAQKEDYQDSMFQLRKWYKKKRNPIYIIIDGLDDAIVESPELVTEVFGALLLGGNEFRYVISGERNKFLSLVPKLKKLETERVKLAGLSEPEVKDFLGPNNLSNGDIKEIFSVTKGFPGRLKLLKRFLDSGDIEFKDLEGLSDYSRWIEIDCENIEQETPVIKAMLAVIAHHDKSFLTSELEKIRKLKEGEISKITSQIPFLKTSNSGFVTFISVAHKRYVANKYRGKKKDVTKLIIEYYISNPDPDSLIELPKLLAQQMDWKRIITVLDDDYLPQILDTTGSLNIVNQNLEIGITASENTGNYQDLWRYSLQGGIVNELDDYTFWESEIEARIAINDFSGAISLAQSAVPRVDVLRLLALVARRQKEFNGKVDEDLVTYIEELYETTELHSIGNKIYDIVADLIYAIPNLAIEMIEKSSGDVSEGNINDWVLAKLSLAAVKSSVKDGDESESTKKLEAVESLNKKNIKKINRAISFMVGKYTPDRVLDEVKKLDDSQERLKLLRLWLDNGRVRKLAKVGTVIEVALDELMKCAGELTITYDLLKELSYQLPFVQELELKQRLLKRFLQIEQDTGNLGLTRNRYIHKLSIFHCQYKLNRGKSIRSIRTLINELDRIDDLLVRAESYSEVYTKLKFLRHPGFKEEIKRLKTKLESITTELFSSTANHFKVSAYVLKTIAKSDPAFAISISDGINTRSRRQRALLHILDSYLDNSLRNVKIDHINAIVNKYDVSSIANECIVRTLERYSESKKLHYSVIENLMAFMEQGSKIPDASDRSYCQVLSYRILAKNDSWKERLSDNYRNRILRTWEAVEAKWDQIDIGFRICSDLSKIDLDFAKDLFERSCTEKAESWIDSRVVAKTYINSLKIIIRAFNNLLKRKLEGKGDFDQLARMISRVPSEVDQLSLWTETGFYAHTANRSDVSKKILDGHVIPLIQGVIKSGGSLEALADPISFVHISNETLALEYLGSIDPDMQEGVLAEICMFNLSGRNPYEVYDTSCNVYNTSYGNLKLAISVLKKIHTDSTLTFLIKDLVEAALSSKTGLRKPQFTELHSELSEIVESTLPDENNIKHDGFKIVALAYISKLNKSLNKSAFWTRTIDSCDTITNTSDRAFVKASILEMAPFDKIDSGADLKAKAFNDVVSDLKSLKIHYEYVQRVIDLSEKMHPISKVAWQELVSRAFSVTGKLDSGGEVFASRRNIIDTMYRMDPDFAKKLVNILDDDNRGGQINKLVKDHYESLRLSDKIKNSLSLEQQEQGNHKAVVRAIFMALKALNSDKLTPKKVTQVTKYLSIANKLPLHEVYPIYWYFLNNCNRINPTKNNSDTLDQTHRDNFREGLKATTCIELLSHKRKRSEGDMLKTLIDDEFSGSDSLVPSSREEALTFIREWLADQSPKSVLIADTYFEKEDLEFLKIVLEIDATTEVVILASKAGINENCESKFREEWGKISDQEPPITEIVFCWIPHENNKCPFHDRWIITESGGLRLGTSINALGGGRESEISIMKPSTSLELKQNHLQEYVSKRKRVLNGNRVQYRTFTL